MAVPLRKRRLEMDIVRPELVEKRKRRRIVWGVVTAIAILLVTLGVSQLRPAAPIVDRNTVWIDTVKRGEMVRQVRGVGTLVPEEIRWIPAATEGRVEKIFIRPGTAVEAETILIELSNPEVEQAAGDVELQVRAAEAELANRRVEVESALLNQRAAAATVQADYQEARLRADVDEELAKQGLTSSLTLKLSKGRAEELATRHAIEQKRLEIAIKSADAQLSVQQARLDQYRALHRLRREQVHSLAVRAGIDGVLQQLPVEVGQRVTQGTILAKVARPDRLKAELRITETQAKDILVGQNVVIDTRNGVVPGRVTRIDPAVQNGTVMVDVALEGALPRGARPDLTVDGTIELDRLASVLYVGRPVQTEENSTVGLFKLIDDGKEAIRVKVRVGRSSVSTIEVAEGLSENDRVILSDMSAWDEVDRIRLR